MQVFRIVTEDTIEEKVVERAQQKLKLDAMVVQQGRLNNKDKLSRDELLNAIRFGADKIFKSKDSSITDDDVSVLLGLICCYAPICLAFSHLFCLTFSIL